MELWCAVCVACARRGCPHVVRESHYFFFFSSRRRHTRCSRDWSSDVCSSDLLCRADVHAAIDQGRVHADDFCGLAAFGQQPGQGQGGSGRSEEHTSELQSRLHLVCRLLLEKKKSTVRDLPVLSCPSTSYIQRLCALSR